MHRSEPCHALKGTCSCWESQALDLTGHQSCFGPHMLRPIAAMGSGLVLLLRPTIRQRSEGHHRVPDQGPRCYGPRCLWLYGSGVVLAERGRTWPLSQPRQAPLLRRLANMFVPRDRSCVRRVLHAAFRIRQRCEDPRFVCAMISFAWACFLGQRWAARSA